MDYNTLTVVKLKQLLRARGLLLSGLKSVLINRLIQSDTGVYLSSPPISDDYSKFPVEVLLNISKHISPQDILNNCKINKQWKELCKTRYFWSNYIGENEDRYNELLLIAIKEDINFFEYITGLKLNIEIATTTLIAAYQASVDIENFNLADKIWNIDPERLNKNLMNRILLPMPYVKIYERFGNIIFNNLYKKYKKTFISTANIHITLTASEYPNSFISFDSKDRKIDDYDFQKDISLNMFLKSIDELTLNLFYEFGKGHTIRKHPVKFVPHWYSPFGINENSYEKWEEKVITILKEEIPEFPYIKVDSDSDFGLQSFQFGFYKYEPIEDEENDDSE